MRQGNEFGQWVDRDGEHGRVRLRLPMELEDEWQDYKTVKWIDNRDGTYTLIPSKEQC